MSMSRKHYREAAEIIRAEVEFASTLTPVRRAFTLKAVENIANGMAGMFKRDNSAFQSGKFFKAAGLDMNGRAQG
jgi:hypothetical protein